MALSFREALGSCLAAIPPGRVTTCGLVARTLGDVRAARSVATWILEHPDIPGAHRVVRADGRPVAPSAAGGLAREGVRLRGGRVAESRFLESLSGAAVLEDLRETQRRLAQRVEEVDDGKELGTFGGVDVAYAGDRAFAVAVRLDARTLETIETCERAVDVDFPYIPTYLAFREYPAVRAALEGLRERPDLLFVDGHGRLHPALFGFACYAGVQLDLPTVGIAKHPLAGKLVPSAPRMLGAIPVEMDGVVRGFAWTPPRASRPFYVSVGHRISLERALREAQRSTRTRYPEPLLVADRITKEERDKKNTERSASG